MKHLTTVFKKNTKEIKSYGLYVSVPIKRAQKISDTLTAELGSDINRKSRFVCDCVESNVLEPIAQKRIEHASDLLDSFDNKQISESARKKLRMALRGCPTTTNTEFTGELSSEYIERYGDD